MMYLLKAALSNSPEEADEDDDDNDDLFVSWGCLSFFTSERYFFTN